MDDYKYLFKLVLVGDSGVGKTSLIGRYMDRSFMSLTGSTIGVDFRIRTFSINEIPIKLQIWDTSGQERFHSITNQYYRNAGAIFVVYDTTNAESFENASRWLDNVQRLGDPNVLTYLVGTKSDIVDERSVQLENAQRFANFSGMKLIETSALTGDKVDDVFYETAQILTDRAMLCDSKLTENVQIIPTDGVKLSNNWKCCAII